MAENCTRLNLPVPEWIIEATEREKWSEAQPPQPGFSPTVAAALPIEVRQFAQKNYEDRNPNLGAGADRHEALTRWSARDLALGFYDALNRGTEAVLRRGQHEQLEREIAINSSSRREAVERAALAVELAVGAGDEGTPYEGTEFGGGRERKQPCTAASTAHGESAIPESPTPAGGGLGTRSRPATAHDGADRPGAERSAAGAPVASVHPPERDPRARCIS